MGDRTRSVTRGYDIARNPGEVPFGDQPGKPVAGIRVQRDIVPFERAYLITADITVLLEPTERLMHNDTGNAPRACGQIGSVAAETAAHIRQQEHAATLFVPDQPRIAINAARAVDRGIPFVDRCQPPFANGNFARLQRNKGIKVRIGQICDGTLFQQDIGSTASGHCHQIAVTDTRKRIPFGISVFPKRQSFEP